LPPLTELLFASGLIDVHEALRIQHAVAMTSNSHLNFLYAYANIFYA
jgi:hypothetical protein